LPPLHRDAEGRGAVHDTRQDPRLEARRVGLLQERRPEEVLPESSGSGGGAAAGGGRRRHRVAVWGTRRFRSANRRRGRIERLGPKGTAPSGRVARGNVRYRALKHPANQIFAPSGRAVGSLRGYLVATRTKRQSASRVGPKKCHPSLRSSLETLFPGDIPRSPSPRDRLQTTPEASPWQLSTSSP
jgi:hypothetical protein